MFARIVFTGERRWVAGQIRRRDRASGRGTGTKVLQSQKASNPDLLAPLLADKFVNTGSDGKVTGKAETLATTKTTKLDNIEYTDVKVTVFGDVAIATGGVNGKGTDGDGKPLDIHERWTDTWVKMANHQWQCVASHASPVKM